MWWHPINSIAVAALLALVGGLSQSANAQAQTAVAQNDCGCWIDTKTGKPVPTVPLSGINLNPSAPAGVAVMDGYDPKADHAFNDHTGQNFVRVPCPPPTATTTPPPGPPSVGMLIVEPRVFFDLVEKADARTAGVPKPSEETQKVEEKKPSFWESLIPALIPEIGIGGGREDRERRFPDDPRR